MAVASLETCRFLTKDSSKVHATNTISATLAVNATAGLGCSATTLSIGICPSYVQKGVTFKRPARISQEYTKERSG
ncbi:hypothetical protein AWC38_SpisGene20505 [Stylophora pistillata]|uniref:Uncharacterized protein n=1 Tax=Stylophora pistillata TaxID=50429 RepID=A0A2B4RG82_STYPI|nr:hypothetical protein AWC38_SpisGene20505 [Stylophora pistillata]